MAVELKRENQNLKEQVSQQRERILYLEGELKRQEQRYLLEVNRWKERHNEKSRELRMILIKMPSQVKEAIELENKQPDEVVHWDSPEKERSPAASKSRDRSPLKPLQLGNSWSQDAVKKAGLPPYKCAVTFRRKTDREKLPAFPCHDCRAWYENDDGVERDKITCRHRELYSRPSTPPGVWDISFPDSPN